MNVIQTRKKKVSVLKFIGFNNTSTMDATKTQEENILFSTENPLSVPSYQQDSPDFDERGKQLFRGSIDENGTTQPTDPNSYSNIWNRYCVAEK